MKHREKETVVRGSYGRVTSMDGRDYRHREQIAARYQQSVKLKFKVRWLSCFQLIFWVVISALGTFLTFRPRWPTLYLCSPLSSILSLVSLPRNNTPYLAASLICQALCGFGPLLFGFLETVGSWGKPKAAGAIVGESGENTWAWDLALFFGLGVHTVMLICCKKLMGVWGDGVDGKSKTE
uniref:protein jagunal homolog 1 isoform X1 n=1 Tax=Myxine glutinosa TaxID=7769 RepID=UPI00358FDFB6